MKQQHFLIIEFKDGNEPIMSGKSGRIIKHCPNFRVKDGNDDDANDYEIKMMMC